MRLLLLNQFFHPDLSATAQLAGELAEDLVAAGIEVTAVASRGSYLGGGRLPPDDQYRGVRIRRLWATSLGKRTLARRAVDYASFYASAAAALLSMPRHDVILALTTPPLIAAAALPARWLRGSRLVCWVQDLYPDVAVAFGVLGARSLAARAMAAASRLVMRRADRVVVLGEAMRRRALAHGAAPDRTVVVPNWADPEVVRPVPHETNPLRAELARGARVLVMYSGNMGRAHDVGTLLGAAERLRHRSEVAFLFQGDGAFRPLVESAASRLPNLRLASYQPRERLAESLSAADLHLVSLAPELAGLIEPSKLYGVMAAGRPAVFVGPDESEVARTIRREGCGEVIRPGDVDGLVRSIEALAADPVRRAAMGARGREALVDRYSRTVATRQFARLLQDMASQPQA
jgi:glycosyltransferase involved in cell wall biosynthesis